MLELLADQVVNQLRKRAIALMGHALQAFNQLLWQLQIKPLREPGWIEAKAWIGLTRRPIRGGGD